jgi:hypothetical protein
MNTLVGVLRKKMKKEDESFDGTFLLLVRRRAQRDNGRSNATNG